MTEHRRISRRSVLRASLGGVGLGLGSLTSLGCGRSSPSASVAAPTPTSPDFSIAFLTDPHVRDQAGAPQGFEKAVLHAFAQATPPEMVITGGDLAFDIMETDRALADEQYGLFDRGLASVKVPIHHTVGNHDCFGVHTASSIPVSDPLYGKGYFLERFGLDRPYRSFDHEGWHFVTLDTIGVTDERGYRGFVDAEQLAWLEDDLAAAQRPTVVVGHIPLFSHYLQWKNGSAAGVPEGIAVVNANEVAEILIRHPVKLVLAGHLHINETYRYKGIEFANIGAVSGNWWQGERDGFQEGYALLDFTGEQVSWRYVDYGWDVPV